MLTKIKTKSIQFLKWLGFWTLTISICALALSQLVQIGVYTALPTIRFIVNPYEEVLAAMPEKTVIKEKEEYPIDSLVAEQIISECKKNGLTSDSDIKWVLGKLWNESRWDIYALNNNGNNGIDRGIAQINSKYHPEVSNACAFDLACSIEFVAKYRKAGKDIWCASDNL